MVLKIHHVAFLALVSVATTQSVTPVEKVISLLEGMKTDIESEGKAEATAYEKQACFCKETTEKKSKTITTGQDTIDKLSAAIADNTATKAAAETKRQDLKDKKEALSQDLEDNTARCAKEKAEYEALAADFNKAISSLKSAIKAMDDKKTAIGNVKASAALLEIDSGVRETLELADAMGLIAAPKQRKVHAFLQQGASVDPKDADYKYHSADIVELLGSLKKDFTAEKATLDQEYGKTEAACTNIKKSLAGKLETNKKESDTTDGKISKLGNTIAEDRGKLVESQSSMQDDEQYLKELTSTCESEAGTFDQRSQLRAGELEALSTALKVLKDKVQGADTAVNKRAFVQQPEKKASAVVQKPAPKPTKAEAKAVVEKAGSLKPTKVTEAAKVGSVAKVATAGKEHHESKKVLSFLQRTVVNAHAHDLSSQEEQQHLKDQIATSLHDEGARLRSPVLTALSMRIAADPFKKVKDLIQGLIERLIKEAAAEATKKGFCDTEIGKATQDRNFRWTQVEKLTTEVAVLQAKVDTITEEIEELTKALETLNKAVEESTKLRKEQKANNANTLTTARKGLTAVNEALLVLRSFYKQAAKAEDDAAGAYTGKQESSNAVLGLLETIVSDFERTIRTTETNEDEAAKAYVEFQRSSKVDIAGKTTQKDLDTQDLKTLKNQHHVKTADHKNNMDLVDDAIKTLSDLRPTCVDTGMSYSDRVAKREEEVKALKKALCLLDTENVEAECK